MRNRKASSVSSSSRARRILDRDGYFHQSLGTWNIHRKGGAWLFFPLYSSDWFHSLLNAPTFRIYGILFFSYIATIFAFGVVYLSISTAGAEDGSSSCSMDISNLLEAYYFSLSTMTTIGYGVSDYYFGDCWMPLIVISLQVCTALVFDSLAIGVIFQRLSRVTKRASTIVFSSRAVLRRVRGELHFMFQVCEVRKHQLVEAHVRVYCVRHERGRRGEAAPWKRGEGGGTTTTPKPEDGGEADPDPPRSGSDCSGGGASPGSEGSDVSAAAPEPGNTEGGVETVYYQTAACRLSHPADELGANLLLSFPNVVVHRKSITGSFFLCSKCASHRISSSSLFPFLVSIFF